MAKEWENEPVLPWSELFRNFTQMTTMHGLQYLGIESRYYIRKMIWVCLMMVAYGVLIYLMASRLQLYFDYGKTTNMEVHYDTEMDFPSVTICNLNPYKRTKLQKLALQDVITVLDSDDYMDDRTEILHFDYQNGNDDHYFFIEGYCDIESLSIVWKKEYHKVTREVCAYMCSNLHSQKCSSFVFNALTTGCLLTSYDGYGSTPGQCRNASGVELYIRERDFGGTGTRSSDGQKCDFETPCTLFSNEPSSLKSESWKRVSSHGNTPETDVTLESDRGHYLLFVETTLRPDYTARYVSNFMNTTDVCVEFFYRFLGHDCMLNVYLRTTDMTEVEIHKLEGSQPELTLEGGSEVVNDFRGRRILLRLPKGVFQIIIEAVRATSGLSGAVIDDINIRKCGQIEENCLTTGMGQHYVGSTQRVTSGELCIPWNNLNSSLVSDNLALFPDSDGDTLLDTRACRNPFDYMDKPYCYYMERFTKLKRGTCNITMCGCDESSGMFQCSSGLCIPSELKCDGKQDCDDNSDETIHCVTEKDVSCDFSQPFVCGYDTNVYSTNISWVRQSSSGASIQNSPPTDNTASTIGYYMMVDNRQAHVGERAEFRSPYKTMHPNMSVSFSYYVTTSAADNMTEIHVYLITTLGWRLRLMSMHISEMVLDQWTSVASTCFPIGQNELYSIGFEATIGYKQAGIAIDGVILKETCESDGTELCEGNNITTCSDLSRCGFVSHTTHTNINFKFFEFKFIGTLKEFPLVQYSEGRQSCSLQYRAFQINLGDLPERHYTATLTSPVYLNHSEPQCISFFYGATAHFKLEIVTGPTNDERELIFEDMGLDQYVQYTKLIEPQAVPYAINYELTTTSLHDPEPMILAFTRTECNSVNSDDTCSCSFTSQCDYHILTSDTTDSLIKIEDGNITELAGLDGLFFDQLLLLTIGNQSTTEISLLRQCKITTPRCLSFDYLCFDNIAAETEIILIRNDRSIHKLSIESACQTLETRNATIALPEGDFAVVLRISGSPEEIFVLDNLKMSSENCTGTPTLDISDVILGDKEDGQDQVKNISTKGVTEVVIPEIARSRHIEMGPELGSLEIMTHIYQDRDLEEVIYEMSHDVKDVILNCTFNNEVCDDDAFEMMATDMGICYTFNYNTSQGMINTKRTGAGSGLEVLLNVEEYDHIDSPRTRSGVKVFMHSQDEIPYVTYLGQEFSTGAHSLIAIDMVETSKLSQPYSRKCRKSEDSYDYYPGREYTYYQCMRRCETNYLNTKCGCKNIYMPDKGNAMDCDVFSYFNCSYQETVLKNAELGECKCLEACDEMAYRGIESSSVLSEKNVDYFLKFNQEEIENTFYDALEIQHRTDAESFNSTISRLLEMHNTFIRLENYIIHGLLNASSSYIRRFEQIVDKMMEVSQEGILNITFKEENDYYSAYLDYQGNHWNGIANSLTSVRQPILTYIDLLRLNGEANPDWLQNKRISLCSILEDARAALFLYNHSQSILDLDLESQGIVPDAALLMTNTCRSQFEDLDILIIDLLDLISCEVNILPGSSLPQDEDLISNATSQIVSIIDEYGTTCTTDYQQFLEEFSRWKLTVENTLKDDSDIKLISETYSVAINVDSTLDDLQNQTKMLNELQQRHSEGTISIHELSTALSSEPYVKLRRELNDKKDHIMEQIFTPLYAVIESRKALLIDWYNKTIYYARELGERLEENSNLFEEEIRQLHIWRKPQPTVDNPNDIYYEYDETELQHSWPEGWDFVTFYEFRSQYITENRVGGFFDELERMIEERETELEDLFYNFDVGFDQLTSDLDFITKENQIDGHFVMQNFLQLNIFYSELKYTSVTQNKDYDLLSFFSDMGGFMGLLIGCSCITICEFLDLIIYYSIVKCATRDKKKRENNNNNGSYQNDKKDLNAPYLSSSTTF